MRKATADPDQAAKLLSSAMEIENASILLESERGRWNRMVSDALNQSSVQRVDRIFLVGTRNALSSFGCSGSQKKRKKKLGKIVTIVEYEDDDDEHNDSTMRTVATIAASASASAPSMAATESEKAAPASTAEAVDIATTEAVRLAVSVANSETEAAFAEWHGDNHAIERVQKDNEVVDILGMKRETPNSRSSSSSSSHDSWLILLLPGSYRAAKLWGDDGFQRHSVVVVGLGERQETRERRLADGTPLLGPPVSIYNWNSDRGPVVKAVCDASFVNVRIETWWPTSHDDSCVEVDVGEETQLNPFLWLIGCHVSPIPDSSSDPFETSDLIKVNHGCSLVADMCFVGPSSKTAIRLEGQCEATLRNSFFTRTGLGSTNQRISKVTGTPPLILEGSSPAIATSYACRLVVRSSEFHHNFGFPVQVGSLNEERGMFGEDLLKVSPEDYIRQAIEQKQQQLTVSKTAKKKMLRVETKHYRKMIEEVHAKRTRGMVELVDCWGGNNLKSRYLEAERTEFGVWEKEDEEDEKPPMCVARLYPWFCPESQMGQLLDEDGSKDCVEGILFKDKEERKLDRDGWKAALGPPEIRSEAAAVFHFLAEDVALQSVMLGLETNPRSLFNEKEDYLYPFCHRSCEEFLLRSPETLWALSLAKEKYEDKPFRKLDDESLEQLRLRLMTDVSNYRAKVCKSFATAVARFSSQSQGSWNVEELLRICWGNLTQKRSAKSVVALASIVALHVENSIPISQLRSEALVESLQCNFRCGERCDECVCGSPHNYLAKTAIHLLAGKTNCTVIDSLLALVGNEEASDHGRTNAADTLAELAFRDRSLREKVIESITRALLDGSNLRPIDRSSLLASLAKIHAKEDKATKSVRRVFKQGRVPDRFWPGGYVTYLMEVGLPVNPNDQVVIDSVDNRTIAGFFPKRVSKEELMDVGRAQRKQSEAMIAVHNSNSIYSCSHCGKAEPMGSPLPKCGRCEAVYYCNRECQEAAWKTHRKVCKKEKKES